MLLIQFMQRCMFYALESNYIFNYDCVYVLLTCFMQRCMLYCNYDCVWNRSKLFISHESTVVFLVS